MRSGAKDQLRFTAPYHRCWPRHTEGYQATSDPGSTTEGPVTRVLATVTMVLRKSTC